MPPTTNHPAHRWMPARFGWADTTLMSIGVCIVALVRSYDYLTGEDAWYTSHPDAAERPASLVGIEAAFPLWWWAMVLIVGAVLILGGMIRKRHFVVFAGHFVLGVTYVGLAVGLLDGYLDVADFDGIRGSATLVPPALYCILVSVRMGVRPPSPWKD